MKTINTDNTEQLLTQLKQRYKKKLNEQITLFESQPSNEISHAIKYMLNSNSKLLRPLLVYCSGMEFGADINQLDCAALAVEMIHVYSLIHDDLPAMDNAPLRRGQQSCHIRFSEATAILAGDALMSMAFQILSQPTMKSLPNILEIIQNLSHATGHQAMVLGQNLDIQYQQKSPSIDEITEMHALKTSKLIQASIKLGALTANAHPNIISTLDKFGYYFGLAFQLKDDILDFSSDHSVIGKPSQQDSCNNYCYIASLPQAHQELQHRLQQCRQHLNQLDKQPQSLLYLLESLHGS